MFKKLRNGKILYGLCNMYPAPGIIENMCPGWDFVWIDGQHGNMSMESIANAVRAAEAIGVDTLIRAFDHEGGMLGKCADLAPNAIMVPMVNNRQEAEKIVKNLHFPPLGRRSYGGRRCIDLGGRMYYKRPPLVIAQIETMEAVENIEDIISTDGIDAIFLGADDLKLQIGIPIDTPLLNNRRLIEIFAKVREASLKVNKFCGCVAVGEDMIKAASGHGYQIIVAGGDSGFIKKAASQTLSLVASVIKRRNTCKPDINLVEIY